MLANLHRTWRRRLAANVYTAAGSCLLPAVLCTVLCTLHHLRSIMGAIRATYLTDDGFTPDNAKRASPAAEGLCKWVHAMSSYDKVRAGEGRLAGWLAMDVAMATHACMQHWHAHTPAAAPGPKLQSSLRLLLPLPRPRLQRWLRPRRPSWGRLRRPTAR